MQLGGQIRPVRFSTTPDNSSAREQEDEFTIAPEYGYHSNDVM